MHKVAKISIVAILSLFVVLPLLIGIAACMFCSSERLTSTVNRKADEILLCPHSLGKVGLTFFRTFPEFGLEMKDLVLFNTLEGAQSDTAFSAASIVASIDTREYIRNGRIVITGFGMDDASSNIYVNGEGRSNFEFLQPADSDMDPHLPFSVNLHNFKLSGLRGSFVSEKDGICVRDINVSLDADAGISPEVFPMWVKLKKAEAGWQGIRLRADGDIHLDDTLEVNIPDAGMKLSDNLELCFSGKASIPVESGDASVDAGVDFRKWEITDMLDLLKSGKWASVPGLGDTMASIISAIPEKLFVDGALSGSIHAGGVLGKDAFPDVNASISLSNLKAHYDFDTVPFYISSADSDIDIHFDMDTLRNSEVIIKQFRAAVRSMNLPSSRKANIISLKGNLTDLFPNGSLDVFDPDLNLKMDARLNMAEANPYIKPMLDTVAGHVPEIVYEILHGYGPMKEYTEKARERKENPDTYTDNASLAGTLAMDMKIRKRLSSWTDMDLSRVAGDINLNLSDIQVHLLDGYDLTLAEASLSAEAPFLKSAGQVGRKSPAGHVSFMYALDFGGMNLVCPDLTMTVPEGCFRMEGSAPRDTSSREIPDYSIGMDMQRAELQIGQDDRVSLEGPDFKVHIFPSDNDLTLQKWGTDIHTDSFRMESSGVPFLSVGELGVSISENENRTGSNFLTKWDPVIDFDIRNLSLDAFYYGSKLDFGVPEMNVTVKDQAANINSSRVKVGNSDFSLSGKIRKFGKWREHREKLKADLKFDSDTLNVNELIDIPKIVQTFIVEHGIVVKDSVKIPRRFHRDTITLSIIRDTLNDRDSIRNIPTLRKIDGIILPSDMDVALDVSVGNATMSGRELRNVRTDICLHDGAVYIDDAGFDCDAAKMDMTGIYSSPYVKGRRLVDSTYSGLNLRMHDIDIKKAVDIIPEVDSLMPLLRSFSGNVDMNLAYYAEYDSLFYEKPDRSRAALCIEGRNLVLVPGDVYKKLSKLLMFRKNDNMIDSLRVEAAWSGDSVTVHPFIISLSRCQLVVGGTNTLNREGTEVTSVDYHLSMIRPLHLGVRVSGPPEHLRFRLEHPVYDRNFIPVARYDARRQGSELERKVDTAVSGIMSALRKEDE